MVLRIELQTRQYHQNVQNFGAELLKQVLVQQKYAQGVTPAAQQQQLQYGLGGYTPLSSSHSGGVTPPSMQQHQALSAKGGHPRANVAPARGGHTPPWGPHPT